MAAGGPSWGIVATSSGSSLETRPPTVASTMTIGFGNTGGAASCCGGEAAGGSAGDRGIQNLKQAGVCLEGAPVRDSRWTRGREDTGHESSKEEPIVCTERCEAEHRSRMLMSNWATCRCSASHARTEPARSRHEEIGARTVTRGLQTSGPKQESYLPANLF